MAVSHGSSTGLQMQSFLVLIGWDEQESYNLLRSTAYWQ